MIDSILTLKHKASALHDYLHAGYWAEGHSRDYLLGQALKECAEVEKAIATFRGAMANAKAAEEAA